MSVAAYHDLNDNSFESFIDADAIDDGSKTVDGVAHVTSMNPSSSAHAALQPPAPPPAQRKNSFETQQHPSLPNTPKLASNFSFGGTGDHMGGMQEPSLHSLSFDWEDLANHQHHQLPSASQSSAPPSIVTQPDLHMSGLNFDPTPMAGHAWPGANAAANLGLHGGRRSMDDASLNLHHSTGHLSTGHLAPGSGGGGVFEAPAMHARSLSLNLHDAAPPPSVDDLNAQAPHVPRPHPFVKMEPGEGMSLDAMPFAHPHPGPFAFHGPPMSHPPMGPAPMHMAGSPPQEKKRKVDEAVTPAKKDNGAAAHKASASAKKAARRKSLKPEMQSSESGTTAQEEQISESNVMDDQQSSQQQSSSTEASADAQDGSGGDGSPRKPAPKSKKPPPSASQITESGKPFPVIDTSATHSSLFVPPDTSGLTKREARLVKNRAAAFLSRQRKREQFELLEKQCKSICRLTWKMWETIAGPDAEVSAIDNTVLPILLSDESPDVRDCLEQIIGNKGASIAPTEESIANGVHQQRQDSWPPAENRSSPSGSAKSGGSKREREDDGSAAPAVNSNGNSNSNEANIITQLRAELEATRQREHSLRMTLSEERSRSSTASSSPSSYEFHPSIMQPPAAHYTHFGPPPHMPHHHPLPPHLLPGSHMMCPPPGAPFAPQPAPSEQGFREGRSSERGLSLTIAPQLTAADVDVDTPTADRSEKKEGSSSDEAELQHVLPGSDKDRHDDGASTSISSPHNSWMGHHSLVAAAQSAGLPNAARRATSSMALMVLLFGWALFGSGGLPGADAPRMGITRLAPIKGAFSSLGQVFDPLATGSAPDLLGLFNRKADEEDDDDDEDMDAGDGRRAPSSHLSAQDLALTLEHHLASSSAADLDHVAEMLPMCSLDDDIPTADAKSRSGAGAKALESGWLRRNQERVQNGFIILGDDEDDEQGAKAAEKPEAGSDVASSEVDASAPSPASVTEEKQTPRKLKLFLRRPASPRSTTGDDASMADGEGASPCTAPSPTSSSTDSQDDVFEDAGARTPVSSSSTSGSARGPSASARARVPSDLDSSFLELEFSLSGKRFVRDEQELASLIQRAAQHATIGGQAAVSGP